MKSEDPDTRQVHWARSRVVENMTKRTIGAGAWTGCRNEPVTYLI